MLKNPRALRLAWFWICDLVCLFSAMAGAAEPSGSPFVVDSWSVREHLPESAAISVIQTRDGYLWIGTLNGLARFDGNHFTIFDENNTPGLNSDRIVFLFEDLETNLWVGTESAGLAVIKNGIVKNFGAAGANCGKVIYAAEDSQRNIVFCASGGMLYFHDGKMDSRAGAISWPLSGFAEKMLAPSKSGGVWQIFNGVVQKWSNNQVEKDFGASPWGNTNVTAACEDENGNLIVGTLGAGIFWQSADGKFLQISEPQGLSSRFVLSLCVDRAGNLWAGTDGGGLDRIKRKIFNSPDALHPFTAQSISADASGGLWMAFNASGVSFLKTNVAEDFGQRQGLLDPNAWTILADRRQQVWVGTRFGGLFQFQTNQFVPAPGAEKLGAQIFALFEDRNGQLWAGTQNGLANFDGQKWRLFTTRDGLSENNIRAIAQDADGNFWIGTENSGLNFFKDGKFISYRAQENGLPGDDISCLYADADGILWIGTSGHGLARFQNGKWTRYSTDTGLASNHINYFLDDGDGNLWIGSNAGLMRIQKRSLDDFAGGAANFISCRTFVESDGLPTRECSAGSQPAACRASDGKLWFPTTKGFVSLNPADIKPNPQPPTVLIESVLVDGREQKTNRLDFAWPQSIVIPPGREQLEIDYTALNFSAPDAVRFKYRLEGRDNAWTDARAERVANYSDLPHGHYFFRVAAENEDGIWNENGSVLEIAVQPQFWQTKTFRVAAVIFALAIVVAIVRFVSTQKLRRELQLHRQKEVLEKERSRIARDLHDQLGANLTQVALLGEMAQADKNSPNEIESHAKQISETARETTHSLDEIVWAINPANDTLEGLANYACKYAQDYFALAGLRYRADLPTELPAIQIPPDVRHNVFLAFKEAVHNVVKHAQASEVRIRLRLQPENFILEIEDDGKGVSKLNEKQNRNGLRNMKKRMTDIHGEFSISAGANGGTIVRLTVPLSKLS